jgi:hypothetical protein
VITYVLAAGNAGQRLGATLRELGSITAHDAELLVVQHAGAEQRLLPARLDNGIKIRGVRCPRPTLASAHNEGARQSDADRPWLVMLDDESAPACDGVVLSIRAATQRVGAIAAEVWLARRERGARAKVGLPEVFASCGVAIRREVFLGLGGYDLSVGEPAQATDLSARLLRAGLCVAFDPGFRVLHGSSASSKGNRPTRALVRDEGLIVERYAPSAMLHASRREARRMRRELAEKSLGTSGVRQYVAGLLELRAARALVQRTPLEVGAWDRLTGLAAAREGVSAALREHRFERAMIVDVGVNAWCVAQALREAGVRLTREGEEAQAHVIGTMCVGEMLNAYERRISIRSPVARPVVLPWNGAIAGTMHEAARDPVEPRQAA